MTFSCFPFRVPVKGSLKLKLFLLILCLAVFGIQWSLVKNPSRNNRTEWKDVLFNCWQTCGCSTNLPWRWCDKDYELDDEFYRGDNLRDPQTGVKKGRGAEYLPDLEKIYNMHTTQNSYLFHSCTMISQKNNNCDFCRLLAVVGYK